MVVSTLRVCLPNFNHGIVDSSTITVKYAADEPYPLAFGFWTGDAGYGMGRGAAQMEIRAYGLRRRRSEVRAIPQMVWPPGRAIPGRSETPRPSLVSCCRDQTRRLIFGAPALAGSIGRWDRERAADPRENTFA